MWCGWCGWVSFEHPTHQTHHLEPTARGSFLENPSAREPRGVLAAFAAFQFRFLLLCFPSFLPNFDRRSFSLSTADGTTAGYLTTRLCFVNTTDFIRENETGDTGRGDEADVQGKAPPMIPEPPRTRRLRNRNRLTPSTMPPYPPVSDSPTPPLSNAHPYASPSPSPCRHSHRTDRLRSCESTVASVFGLSRRDRGCGSRLRWCSLRSRSMEAVVVVVGVVMEEPCAAESRN